MQNLLHVAIVVSDYDDAIQFYCQTLGFELLEDTYQPEQDKRWVVVAPAGSMGASILLAKASNENQLTYVGDQTGGRVSFFLHTHQFWDDYQKYLDKGVNFVRPPSEMPYGTVAVFEDLYGNRWDLIQLSDDHPHRQRGV